MTKTKLTDEDYDVIVEALTERAMLGTRSMFREQIKNYIPKELLEKTTWDKSAKPIYSILTININQQYGDALLEWEKRRK
jgi:hypothetical protein